MASAFNWICKSCGAVVSVAQSECPRCKARLAADARIDAQTTPQIAEQTPAWVRAISIPTALLGMLVFFLPWVEISCGAVRVSFSGYDFATGGWQEKLESKGGRDFWQEFQLPQSSRSKGRRLRPGTGEPSVAQRAPLLWVVPSACALLVLLGIFGLPRIATILISLAAASYLAYFGITFEQEASDPRNTLGIVDHRWLLGYWVSCLSLALPAFVAVLRPQQKG